MKRLYVMYVSLFLILLLASLSTEAAGTNSHITKEEAALWAEAFGETITTKEPKPESVGKDTSALTNISGVWVGYYEYDKPKGQPAGMFNAVIRDLGEQFAISFLEPRNRQDEYVQWAVNTSAIRQGRYIEFTKVYGHNENTQIQYNLTIRHDGAIMDGTWKIDDRTYGRAFFYKVDLQELKEIKQQAAD